MDTAGAVLSKFSETKWAQQECPSIRPTMGPKCGYATFAAFAAIFLVLGVVLQVTSGAETLMIKPYDGLADVKFEFGKDVKGDIVLFYQLTNFHQNHRRFVTSRSADQLAGKFVSWGGLESCDKLRGPRDLDGGSGAGDKVFVPAGLAARSYFTDRFEVLGDGDRVFKEEGLAPEGDKKMFSAPAPEYNDANADMWLANSGLENNQTNEHFIVWMRPAALPTVVKPYAICRSCEFRKGEELVVRVLENSYSTDMFHGTKSLGLGVDSWVGFRNTNMGIICFVHAGVWIVCIAILLLIRIIRPRKIGDQELIAQRCREYAAEFGRS